MFSLVGMLCLNLSGPIVCTHPTAFVDQYPTEAKCEDQKNTIKRLIDPVAWLDAELKCVEGEPII